MEDKDTGNPTDAPLPNNDNLDVEVADTPADARTIVTGMTVSASEKVSTGDYENYEPFQSVRVTFDPALNVSTDAGRVALHNRARRLHRDIQNDIESAVDAKLSAPGQEDWDIEADAEDTDGQ